MNERKLGYWIIGIIVLLIACLLCLCTLSGSITYWMWKQVAVQDTLEVSFSDSTPTPQVLRPTIDTPTVPFPLDPTAISSTPQVKPSGMNGSSTYSQTSPQQVLEILNEADVPVNDLVDLAQRLQGKKNIQRTQPPPAKPPQIGDTQSFWITNADTNESFQVQTTLRYITDHAYFWIENGVSYRERELQDLAEAFEKQIYPTNREFFGSEWNPGADGDPRIYILYVRNAGANIAGYFSSVDSYPPEAHEYSNWHETFVFNADTVDLNEEFTYGVLAHEFQHMIHWANDRNEEIWVNEAFSELAMLLNNYDTGGHDWLFSRQPDLQLNDWPTDQNITGPHYGASFLFMTYFLDRFGEDATKQLVQLPENGLTSIDLLMKDLGIRDPRDGQIVTADDIFVDWTIANYLNDPKVDDGRYYYSNYSAVPKVSDTESIRRCDSSLRTREVHQYGADYIRIRCSSPTTLTFEGSTIVGLLPADPYSGAWAFWSNKGDESDMTLTRMFDFTQVEAPLTLSYWTWYDLEKDYDFAYVLASTNGEDWEMLRPPSGTDNDLTGNNFGFGYNGRSGGGDEAVWIQEQVDLSKFAGQKVQIRFEYVTDAAVNGEGMLVDDIAIPEIGYFTDFEADDGGWEAAGFVRVQNILPQTYRLSLIRIGKITTVESLDLSADNTLELPLEFGSDLREVVLVISGTTRFTRQPTAYRFFFSP
ncbi:MAG: immune inhibitor A [Anaerolineales bacterium]